MWQYKNFCDQFEEFTNKQVIPEEVEFHALFVNWKINSIGILSVEQQILAMSCLVNLSHAEELSSGDCNVLNFFH